MNTNNENTNATPDYVVHSRAVAGLIDLQQQVEAKNEAIDDLTRHLDNALVVIEDYLDALRETAGLELSGKALEAARELSFAGLIELPAKRYTVDYVIGMTYSVQIDAIDEKDAERIFEERYREERGELDGAEENEITHEVQNIEVNSFN